MLCKTLPINDCELDGAFEFESAECGDGESPLSGWLLFVAKEHGCISRAELTFVVIGSLYERQKNEIGQKQMAEKMVRGKWNKFDNQRESYLECVIFGHRNFDMGREEMHRRRSIVC